MSLKFTFRLSITFGGLYVFGHTTGHQLSMNFLLLTPVKGLAQPTTWSCHVFMSEMNLMSIYCAQVFQGFQNACDFKNTSVSVHKGH